ncbi:GNAT family N-acetyltransferase [Paenibacillus sp. FSL R5-0345]|uniref:GNAT family N-acetyltransferase n=1 Tax=Paenibacillus sp. FSL E2-0201 TaxID=2954726 RepID=UPI0005A78B82
MINLNKIVIAEYQEQDRRAVCSLLVDAFHGKFHSLIPLDDDDITDLLFGLWALEQQSTSSQQIVAQENGEVVGTLSIKWKDCRAPKRSNLKTPQRNSHSQVFKQFGYINVCKLMVGLRFLNYQPRAKECYIEHLAVRSSHRNKGIGKQLLSWAIEFVNSHSDMDKLTLHVAENNKQAIQMYQQMNFGIVQSNYSGIKHLLFKEANWLYMTRSSPLHPRSAVNEIKY